MRPAKPKIQTSELTAPLPVASTMGSQGRAYKQTSTIMVMHMDRSSELYGYQN